VTSRHAQPIAFLDSGIGGIPYLEGARRLLPGHYFAYYADRGYFPYGEKSPQQLRQLVRDAVSRMIDRWDPCLIVVACNTASVVALEALRAQFTLPFVGVVPAVKPAATVSPRGSIGIMATQRTVSDPYVSRLIRDFAPDHEVKFIAAGGLIEAIERGEVPADLRRTQALLAGPVEELRRSGVDSVVLGCTHFIHAREQISSRLGAGVHVVDSVDGVVRQISRQVRQTGCRADAPLDSSPLFFCSTTLPQSYERLIATHGYLLETDDSLP
jgi:glutamate racemase